MQRLVVDLYGTTYRAVIAVFCVAAGSRAAIYVVHCSSCDNLTLLHDVFS
jgi:hypothetical protein